MLFGKIFSISIKIGAAEKLEIKNNKDDAPEIDLFSKKYGTIADFVHSFDQPAFLTSQKDEENKTNSNERILEKSRLIRNKFEKVKAEFKEWSLLTKFDCFSKIFQTKNMALKIT